MTDASLPLMSMQQLQKEKSTVHNRIILPNSSKYSGITEIDIVRKHMKCACGCHRFLKLKEMRTCRSCKRFDFILLRRRSDDNRQDSSVMMIVASNNGDDYNDDDGDGTIHYCCLTMIIIIVLTQTLDCSPMGATHTSMC
jgi:hypothetical protein